VSAFKGKAALKDSALALDVDEEEAEILACMEKVKIANQARRDKDEEEILQHLQAMITAAE
jgi:hypothetical protein